MISDLPSTISVPIKLERVGDSTLKINWQDGSNSEWSARFLRLNCPCAACVHEWTGKRTLNEKTIPESILPKRIYSIGRYAMGIEFSDGHNSGIYSYDFLYQLKPVKKNE